jgi:hypothetical protein
MVKLRKKAVVKNFLLNSSLIEKRIYAKSY